MAILLAFAIVGRLLIVPVSFAVLLAIQVSGVREPLILLPALALAVIGSLWAILSGHQRRAKPEGYVGKFRRPDGMVVHVARLADARLMVASDTQPPTDLGSVEGRELVRWEKLGTEPDR